MVLMWMTAGLTCIVVGLGMGLFEAHVRRVKGRERPRWTVGSAYALLFPLARRGLLAVGLVVLFLVSTSAALIATAALAVLAWRLAWVRSERYVLRGLRRAMASLHRERPGVGEQELLGRLILARHPEWGEQLAAQIVRQHPTMEGVARILARMERGRSGLG